MLNFDRARRIKRTLIWMLLTVWTVTFLSTAPRRSLAKEPDKGGDKAAPADKAAPEAPKEEAKPAKPQETVFWWIIRSSGLIGLVILILSIYFVQLAARLFIEMRPQIAMPPEVIARCEALLEQRDFKSIFGVVKEDNSFFSTALSTGIAELPNGLAEAREAMERVGESVTTEMEKKISPLAVIGTLGPMIGLIGTLKGMITSFSVIAMGGENLSPQQVAGGISEALLLTFEGVFLSIPAIFLFSLFRHRITTISVQTMVRADQFLRHFAHAARSKAPAGGGPAPGAAPGAAKVARP